ncbi:hypothetical protein [Streptomyces sp.]|uniref:hypothetical protein n=1 Tax=Streptomyces sp. TaxID=1931 RepID=UPI002D57D200|nr:hypothetical protein [Streptomyces sp.]HZF93178.1 hypothetical protein [Streptomyces sp.]
MTDVVDSDELVRRIQRGRAWALREENTWRQRSDALRSAEPEEARDAAVRALAYQAVIGVLDEILTPGRHPEES